MNLCLLSTTWGMGTYPNGKIPPGDDELPGFSAEECPEDPMEADDKVPNTCPMVEPFSSIFNDLLAFVEWAEYAQTLELCKC